MNIFTIPSSREPVTYIDPAGKTAFSRSWFLFFQQLFERVGGSVSQNLSDIAETLQDEVRSQPVVVAAPLDDVLLSDLRDLRDEVAELRKLVEGIQQGTTI